MSALYKRSGSANSTNVTDTTLAEIEAASGNQLVNFTIFSGHTNTTNNGHSVTVTYTDGTTSSRTPATGGQRHIYGNDAALVEFTNGRYITIVGLNQTKKVKKIRVATNGDATANKFGSISAMEIPESESVVRRNASGTSAATTPTVFASVTANSDKVLTRWTAFAGKGNVADTGVTIRVTFTDNNTSELSTGTTAIDENLVANPAGIIHAVSNGYSNHVLFPTDKSIKKIEIITAGSGTGTRVGAISAIEDDDDSRRKIDAGISTTGGGVKLADVQSSSGKWLEAFTVLGAQTSASDSAMNTVATYSDSTTTSQTTSSSAARVLTGNYGGLFSMNFAAGVALESKPVNRLRSITSGDGTGTRFALIAAIEGPEVVSGVGSVGLSFGSSASITGSSAYQWKDSSGIGLNLGLSI